MLRNAPPAVQQAVLALGPIVDAIDPTGVLISRIGTAKKKQAAPPSLADQVEQFLAWHPVPAGPSAGWSTAAHSAWSTE